MSDNASLVIVVCGISLTITAIVFILARAAVEALRITRGRDGLEPRGR